MICGEFILHFLYKKYGTASSSVDFKYTKSSKRFEYFGSFEFVHVLAIYVFTSPKIDIKKKLIKKINFVNGVTGQLRRMKDKNFRAKSVDF